MNLVNYRFPLLGLLTLLISACSVAPYQPSQPPVEERSDRVEQPAQTTPAPAVEEPESEPSPAVVTPLPEPAPSAEPSTAPQPQITQNSAVVALLDSAEQSRAAGDYRSAQGSLQRAQRIAPRDPEVYYSLAVTHMEQENFDLAEQVALKGVSVAQGNPYQSQRLWKLIAKIRLRAGDPAGARQAEQKAATY